MTLSGGYFHGYYNGTEYPFSVGNNYVANNTTSYKLALGYNNSTAKIEAYVNGAKQSFGDTLPVGTILAYVGSTANIPSGWALCNGANGTPNLTGRFLEGVTSASAIKSFKAAGLPNITGSFSSDGEWSVGTLRGCTGAFKIGAPSSEGDYPRRHATLSSETSEHMWDFRTSASFYASLCSSIYGNSTTVQPASYTVMYIMKIKA